VAAVSVDGKRRRAIAPSEAKGHGANPRPISRASLVKIRSVLGQALTWAERRQLVARNVVRVVALPAEARPGELAQALTVEQARHPPVDRRQPDGDVEAYVWARIDSSGN
jgi:hypothetical protein